MSGRPTAALRPSGRQRRLDILEATLRIMRRDGLRAVSHRTVAAEARVPLASTTYYFSDLEDLITESFLHWSQTSREQTSEFHATALAVLQRARNEGTAPEGLVAGLADVAAVYVVDQVTKHRSERVLEFAFLHEAARMPRLRAVVRQRQSEDLRFLEEFHAALGSRQSGIDAQISYSLLLGLEKSALLADEGEAGLAATRRVLVSYLARVVPAATGSG
jgi:DNA-binding transcriptional regulator YbjK